MLDTRRRAAWLKGCGSSVRGRHAIPDGIPPDVTSAQRCLLPARGQDGRMDDAVIRARR